MHHSHQINHQANHSTATEIFIARDSAFIGSVSLKDQVKQDSAASISDAVAYSLSCARLVQHNVLYVALSIPDIGVLGRHRGNAGTPLIKVPDTDHRSGAMPVILC